MQVTCVYSKRNIGAIPPVYYDHVLAGLQRTGAVLVEESDFIQQPIQPQAVIGFFVTDSLADQVYSGASPENRWMYLVDTKVNDDDGTNAYQGRIGYAHRLNIKNTVITYPIDRYTQRLHEAGIRTTVMPCCVSRQRSRTPKYNGVCVTGTYDPKVYPTRYRLGELFRKRLPGIAGLPVPRGHKTMMTQSNAPMLKGDAYYEMLDGCQMAVVCRGGIRDCMVAKYVEFGASHVLPIGDVPSYMPREMAQAMINVDGMSDEHVISEVQRLLSSPGELFDRQEAYSSLVHRHFDLLTNAKRVYDSISLISKS